VGRLLSMSDENRTPSGPGFRTTLWTVVRRAGDDQAQDVVRNGALEELCRTYWSPLYVWLRRDGHDPEQAKDLVQGLFVRLLEGKALSQVDAHRGRFRHYLLAALKNHVLNQRDHEHAARRGGGRTPVPLDMSDAEEGLPAVGVAAPDHAFEQEWARSLVRGVLADLERAEISRGRGEVFKALAPFLSSPPPPGALDRAGDLLSLRKSAVKVSLHRLRRRFAETIRSRIADTVETPDEAEDELQNLLAALSAKNE